MKFMVTVISIYFYALLSSGTTSRGDEDKQWLHSLVDFVELEYEDYCEQRAAATWMELITSSSSPTKLERDKSYGVFSRSQTTDVKEGLNDRVLSDNDEVFKRKVNLLLYPGDTLLETEQWIRLVTFGDTALNNLRFATDYDCGTNTSCSLKELHSSIARQQDEETLKRMKQSWEKKLPSLDEYLEKILPLVHNASRKNNFQNVEEYWNFLAEYEGAMLKARELWENIKPLYVKLHKYIALRLKGKDAVEKPLPVYLLRSIMGDDWLNIIEYVLPKHPDIYKKIHANIQIKELGGKKAFIEAGNLLKELNFGELNTQTWNDLMFNGSCPTTLVDYCKTNKIKAISCKDVSLGNYIDANEAVMKIKYKQTVSLHSNNTYSLREANRYSAVYEAIPGFVSLLALHPHGLDRANLYKLATYNYNPNHNRLVLQLIMALRDLPRLNYYIAVDEWRLKVLTDSVKNIKSPNWKEFRYNFSLIEGSEADILGDPYVAFNRPYVGKFMGLILKYQIYQSYAEELRLDELDLIKHVAENNGRLLDVMMQGYGVLWPEMVSDLLAKRENGLDFTAVTDYFTLLDEYLDKELDPSMEKYDFDYVEPIVPEPQDYEDVSKENTKENEIVNDIRNSQENPKDSEKHANVIDNIIDTGDELNPKITTEASTVGVLEIKNPVPPANEKEGNVKEASYNVYWWIGVAVALAIVVILIAIIAKKRHNHRKQLEKHRRDNSRA